MSGFIHCFVVGSVVGEKLSHNNNYYKLKTKFHVVAKRQSVEVIR